jgi:hypothetical protein
MSGKTRDHWRRLALWPLDVACQLVYGEDPKGMLPEDIRNPDIDGRPDSVSLYHQASPGDIRDESRGAINRL